MSVLLENLLWIPLNIFLAILPVFFSFFLLSKRLLVRVIFFVLWLLFVPNTIYLVTDIEYLPFQIKEVESPYQIILIIQYLFLLIVGIFSFILSVKFFERLLNKHFDKKLTFIILFLFNYLIAFGVVLGKIERANSWYVFTNIGYILNSTINLFSSDKLIISVLIFGTFCNILYFSLRKINKPKR